MPVKNVNFTNSVFGTVNFMFNFTILIIEIKMPVIRATFSLMKHRSFGTADGFYLFIDRAMQMKPRFPTKASKYP